MPINGNRQTILTVWEDINDLNYILIMDVLFIRIGDNCSTENNIKSGAIGLLDSLGND